jgi:hypothetical protein
MTQVMGKFATDGSGGEGLLGEFESAGLSVGWNRATLTEKARAALYQILESSGGATDRAFELRHGPLVLLRCRMIGARSPNQLSFDGSQRRRTI